MFHSASLEFGSYLLLFFLQGAFVYEGKMIDRPLLLQAENIVNLQEIIRSLDST